VSTTEVSPATVEAPAEHLDVLIVGAGISGIGAACHLRSRCPGKTFAILESRGAIGGTWDLFRYPGIRSDSDMFTLGYSFRPWEDPRAIADGPSIRTYVRDTAREHGVDRAIRFHHRVVRAEWSTPEARWSVEVERTDTGETVLLSCGFLQICTGYYRYDEGYTPTFAGAERFGGPIIHPQHWPEDLDYTDKRVVVIGSGATAVTLLPAMAERAAHVTMLQRSPTYIVALPSRDPLAERLRRLPPRVVYSILRWKNVLLMLGSFRVARRWPEFAKRVVRRGIAKHLPPDYELDADFKPHYEPWDQRVCLVPDGDLFAAMNAGQASIVTDQIETFTETGIRLASGDELEADIIVTATGLNVQAIGGARIAVDGREVELSETVAYKGMMLSGVPNLALTLGYTNASWTLRCDLVSEYVCRLLNHMDERGYVQCTPREPPSSVAIKPFLDLKSGYVQRSLDALPKQGTRSPWRLHQNYPLDRLLMKTSRLEDEGVEFSRAGPAMRPAELVSRIPDGLQAASPGCP